MASVVVRPAGVFGGQLIRERPGSLPAADGPNINIISRLRAGHRSSESRSLRT